jgi:hypothetical protein
MSSIKSETHAEDSNDLDLDLDIEEVLRKERRPF